jgi:hypothetical protein
MLGSPVWVLSRYDCRETRDDDRLRRLCRLP